MNARFRVPCPEWGERSQRAFHVAMCKEPEVRGRRSRVVNSARETPASWAHRRPGRPGDPAAAGSAESGVAPGRPKVAAKAVAAGRPLRGAGGRRQKLEVGRAQGLEQGELVHHRGGAASWAAKEVQKSSQTQAGPGVTAMWGRRSGLAATRSTMWS